MTIVINVPVLSKSGFLARSSSDLNSMISIMKEK